MTQEVYEILENGNNKKESNFYLQKAKQEYYERDSNKKISLDIINKALSFNPSNYEALAEKANIIRYIAVDYDHSED